jgi:hypothetical protein
MNLGLQILITLLLAAVLRIIEDPNHLVHSTFAGTVGAITGQAIGYSGLPLAIGLGVHLLERLITRKSAGTTRLWIAVLVMVPPWVAAYFKHHS